ncbi:MULTISPECIES: DUF1934 domain-containing protein [unclassified Paenibacillus]|uniref:DUF1934 domain-containing protein n=1 Tax=unclassified Paenibacillus TaxID=185978 RepID=UPI00095693AB|nr:MULTISPECIES: DUF1934 domain-containing protein [unclassified Paenibacillus]ASS67836.1 DUF1934 domain-containing protein [Paenibacillus sp. RUD330]SIR59659.1 Uncharacterized beta-barrel protein YwiB, DUF1934 family [Paenibacillus sp. RU4X]SIR68456.1 Uncharacterized beta-barrel protein YwiB, DUF1934 family [Paenibacillus sp. RU4T]
MKKHETSRPASDAPGLPTAEGAAEAGAAVRAAGVDEGRAAVLIAIHSIQDGEAAPPVTHKGEFFPKGKSRYIRYEELDELHGAVRTLIRWSGDEISLTRRGGVESEQTFAAGSKREGSYASGHLAFRMTVETEALSAEGEAGGLLPLTLAWTYRLRIEDQLSGRFQLRLHIQEDTHS